MKLVILTQKRMNAVFTRDSTVRTLQFQLQQMLSEPVENLSGPYRSLVDIGVKTDENGQLTVDDTKLQAVLDDDPLAISRVLSHSANATDPQVEVSELSDDVAAGLYALNLTTYDPIAKTLEGTIGGFSGTSTNGNLLDGTSALVGLQLKIIGGTTGTRGNITVTSGVIKKMDDLIKSYLEPEGTFSSRNDSLNDQLKVITEQRESLSLRAESIRARYLRQFSALDGLIAQMQGTSEFLTQQINNISQIANFRSNRN